MSKINIGKGCDLNLDRLLITRLLIQASSGGGKSWLLRRLIEQAFAKVQIIVVDPEGEFQTLREKFDFVLAGKGGDTPVDLRSAELLATKLLELNASAVCDLYEMKPGERHQWVKLFLDSLINAPKELWRPLLVIVDEAHVFCPERGKGDSVAKDSVLGLITRGRKRGYCAVLATQRLAKLDKDAAAELLNVMVGRTILDVDRDRAAEALGIRKGDKEQFHETIRTLKPGEFFFLGPAVGNEGHGADTTCVGGVETTHPESGSARAGEKPPTPAKIRALLPKLEDLPKEAETKVKTEADLRKEIVELRKVASQARTETVTKEVPVLDEKKALAVAAEAARTMAEVAAAYAANLDKSLMTIEADVKNARALVRSLQSPRLLADINLKAAVLDKMAIVWPPPSPLSTSYVLEAKKQAEKAKDEATGVADFGTKSSNGHLSSGEKVVLIAIAQSETVDRNQLSVLTGYKKSSRDAYISRLLAKGYVAVEGSTIRPTQEGVSALGNDYEPLPTGEDLRDYWMRKLPEGERKLLELVIAQYPHPVDRETLSGDSGYKKSSRDAYISRLSSRRLVVANRDGVKASATLF